MKANRVLTMLFSSVFVAAAAVLLPAPAAGVVRAEEAVVAEAAEDTKQNTETVQENAEDIQEQTEDAGQNTEITEEEQLTEEEIAEREAEAARKALQNDPNHIHHFKWIAKMNESESAEGTINYMCAECGKIWYFRPIAPYYAFQGDVARRIEIAPEGATVKVKTSHFINFNKQVMEALAERQDVSLYVSFLDQEYKGNRVSFVIPADQDTMSLLDENGYAGFLYLGGIYGLKMEVPAVTDDAKENVVEETVTSTEETVTSTEEAVTVTDTVTQ
jgi:hypothetical protein